MDQLQVESLYYYESSSSSDHSSPASSPHEAIHGDGLLCRWKGCNCETSSTLELKNHIERDHLGSNKGSYKCEWQDCAFGERRKIYDVKTHITLHHQHLSHYCKDCNKGFLRDQELRKHRKLGCTKKMGIEDRHVSLVPSLESPHLDTISSPESSDHEHDDHHEVPVLNKNKKRQRVEQQEEITVDFSKREKIEKRVFALEEEEDEDVDEEVLMQYQPVTTTVTQQSQPQQQLQLPQQQLPASAQLLSPKIEPTLEGIYYEPPFSMEDNQELEFSEVSEDRLISVDALLDEEKLAALVEANSYFNFQQVPTWPGLKPTASLNLQNINNNNNTNNPNTNTNNPNANSKPLPSPFSFSNPSLRSNASLFPYRDLTTLPTFATLNSSSSSNNLAAMANTNSTTSSTSSTVPSTSSSTSTNLPPSLKLAPLNANSKSPPISPAIPTPSSPSSSYFFPSSPPSSFFVPLSLVSPNPQKSSSSSLFAPILSTKTSPVRMASTTIPQRTNGFFPKPINSSASSSNANSATLPPLSFPSSAVTAGSHSLPSSASTSSSLLALPPLNSKLPELLPEILPLPSTAKFILEAVNKQREKLDSTVNNSSLLTDMFSGMDLKKEEKDEGVPPKPNFVMSGKKPPTEALLSPSAANSRAISLIEKILKRV